MAVRVAVADRKSAGVPRKKWKEPRKSRERRSLGKGRGRKQRPQYTEVRRKDAHIPVWLRPKLTFLHKGMESRESFFERIAELYPPSDLRYKLIEKAYDTGRKEFRHIKRDDGDRYFEHLRATALIGIVYLRLDDANLIAALLLHDILEDIESWDRNRLALEFNEDVADLVWWVSKPELGDKYPTKLHVDRGNARKLNRAPRRAIIIKLCDRLHNLITLWSQDMAKLRRKVYETWDLIIPLAERHQLLIHELEDVLKCVEKLHKL